MKHNVIKETATIFTQGLLENNIPFTYEPLFDGGKWTFPKYPHGDVALHSGTYHSAEGYVESYGMPWDNGDVSVCLPHEMICRIIGEESRESGEKKYNTDDLFGSLAVLLGLLRDEED